VVISRFLPIIRTYIPFVAGLAPWQPLRFTLFNIAGAVAWVASITYAGYFFGNIPWIRNNLTGDHRRDHRLSMVPVVLAWLKERK
jgi:membrane-associated protein